MSQGDIIEVLKKNIGKPLSLGEVQELLDCSVTAVAHALATLLKHDEIKIIEIGREEALKKYHCKRRIRLYYID